MFFVFFFNLEILPKDNHWTRILEWEHSRNTSFTPVFICIQLCIQYLGDLIAISSFSSSGNTFRPVVSGPKRIICSCLNLSPLWGDFVSFPFVTPMILLPCRDLRWSIFFLFHFQEIFISVYILYQLISSKVSLSKMPTKCCLPAAYTSPFHPARFCLSISVSLFPLLCACILFSFSAAISILHAVKKEGEFYISFGGKNHFLPKV